MHETGAMSERHEVYFAKLETQIEQWRRRLDTWAAKAEKLTAEARRAYERGIDERRAKLAVARQKLDALKHIGGDKWEEGKATLESFWKEAKAILDEGEPPVAHS